MATKKPKWQGRKIEVNGREGLIIYAGGPKLLVQFPDKSRVWLTRPAPAQEGDSFKILG
jgi:hypothetical protein